MLKKSRFRWFGDAQVMSLWCNIAIERSMEMVYTWWRHQMQPFFALLALCAGNSPVTLIMSNLIINLNPIQVYQVVPIVLPRHCGIHMGDNRALINNTNVARAAVGESITVKRRSVLIGFNPCSSTTAKYDKHYIMYKAIASVALMFMTMVRTPIMLPFNAIPVPND